METFNIKLECDSIGEIDTKHYQNHLSVELINVNEQQLINEVLEHLDIEKLLMQIDLKDLSNEIQRRLEEDD